MQRSISFYQTLGFAPAFQWLAEDKALEIVHLKLDDMLLELFCYRDQQPSPASSQSLDTDLPRIGVKHFGVKTDNIHLAKSLLEERELAQHLEIHRGRTGIDYFFVRDPDGIFVEIVQDKRNL